MDAFIGTVGAAAMIAVLGFPFAYGRNDSAVFERIHNTYFWVGSGVLLLGFAFGMGYDLGAKAQRSEWTDAIPRAGWSNLQFLSFGQDYGWHLAVFALSFMFYMIALWMFSYLVVRPPGQKDQGKDSGHTDKHG